jgi:hypothetical protein
MEDAIAGTILTVCPKRTFDFSALAIGGSQEVVLTQGVDLSTWREASLVVRLHKNSFGSYLGEIDVAVALEGRTDEESGMLFASPLTTFYPITVASSAATFYVGKVFTSAGNTVGEMLKISVVGSRTSSGTANSIAADLSIDLVLKNADPIDESASQG